MAKRRRFTPEFKQTDVVIESLSGQSSQAELCRRHNLYEEVIRNEIKKLSLRYPKYSYRRIRKLLLRTGYTVGYRRVARLMNYLICWSTSNAPVKPLNPLTVSDNKSTDLITLTSIGGIRSGLRHWYFLY